MKKGKELGIGDPQPKQMLPVLEDFLGAFALAHRDKPSFRARIEEVRTALLNERKITLLGVRTISEIDHKSVEATTEALYGASSDHGNFIEAVVGKGEKLEDKIFLTQLLLACGTLTPGKNIEDIRNNPSWRILAGSPPDSLYAALDLSAERIHLSGFSLSVYHRPVDPGWCVSFTFRGKAAVQFVLQKPPLK